MIFSSMTFLLVFLPTVIILYFFCPAKKMGFRNAILLIASIFFYAWGEPANVVLILACLLTTYCLSFAVVKKSKLALVAAVIANLAPLLIYKYADFLILNFNYVTSAAIKPIGLVLPIGISFYTFQVLTYVIDLYRGRVSLSRNPANLALYIFLFPQLIAGPIVRYSEVEKEIHCRESTWAKTSAGLQRFIIGLAKKMLIANQAGFLVSTISTIREQSTVSVVMQWITVIAYGVQILFDFSGYSDMAIGLGQIFGFHFNENFNKPYVSRSITDFWHRWHISLSTFFRDYVYIPLGGSRVGTFHHLLNLFIVWLLTGLWHGAYWNYALWGIYYFVILVLEKYIYGKWLARVPEFLARFITFFFYMFGWAIFMFESNSLPDIGRNLAGLFGFMADSGSVGLRSLELQGSALIVALGLCISMISMPKRLREFLIRHDAAAQIGKQVVLFLTLVVCIFVIVGESFNPFIYFRF